jgi:hypothetical protein
MDLGFDWLITASYVWLAILAATLAYAFFYML